jgi:hypothetical protein
MNQPAFRRDVMLAALFSSLPIGLVESAAASPLNPEQTIIRPPAELQWKPNPAYSEPSVDNCILAGDINQPGLYYTLIRWWPGFMSAPHHYTSDRLCVVVSGTWWCNSGQILIPQPVFRCQPEVSFAGLPGRRTMTVSYAAIPSRRSSPSAGLGQ